MNNKPYSNDIKNIIADIVNDTPRLIYLGDLPYVIYLDDLFNTQAHIFELDSHEGDFSVKKPPSTRPHYRHGSVVYTHAIATIRDAEQVKQIKSLDAINDLDLLSLHEHDNYWADDDEPLLTTHIDAHTIEYDLIMSMVIPLLKEKVDAHKESVRLSGVIIKRENKRIKSHTDEINHITTILNKYEKKD